MPGFVRHLPSKMVPGRAVPVLVRATKREDTRFWDRYVRRHVRACDPPRADHEWRWRRILGSAGLVARVLGQEPTGFTLGVEYAELDAFVPCAMVFLAGRFPAVDDPSVDSVFLWFVASAPRSFLDEALPPELKPGRLGEAALDIAVTHSLNNGLDGRIGLHADEAGGDTLLDWYQARGLTSLAREAPLRRRLSTNDGRYFFFSPETALAFSRSLDEFRADPPPIRHD
jgi:hypothetical protein